MTRSVPSRLGRIGRAALPAVPFALIAIPKASAVIVYTNPADMTIVLGGSNQIFVDLGSNGGTGSVSTSTFTGRDFALKIYSSGKPYVRGTFGGVVASNFDQSASYRLRKLSFGTSISSSSVTGTNPTAYLDNTTGAQWAPGDNGYFGLSFNGGSGIVYAWVQLTYNLNGTVTLHDFAYETSGGAILAGAGAVPEPSTYAMMAGLLAGSAALYRRRQKNSSGAAVPKSSES